MIRMLCLDFDGVLTSNRVYVLPDGSEAVRCYRGDGVGLRRVQDAGVLACVISAETSPIVSVRCRKLGIAPCHQSVDDKLHVLSNIAAMQSPPVSLEDVVYVGNDLPDLACLLAVGYPVLVADAHPELAEALTAEGKQFYQTLQRGGDGAVRDVCDWIVGRHRGQPSAAFPGLLQVRPDGVTVATGNFNIIPRGSVSYSRGAITFQAGHRSRSQGTGPLAGYDHFLGES